MSELQTADDGITFDESDAQEQTPIEDVQESTEPAQTGAELAPASSGESEESTSDGMQKAINKQHYKFREEQRRANELETKLKEAEERLNTFNKPTTAEVPEMPDSWDDNYAQKMQERDAAIQRKVLHDQQAQHAKDQEVIAKQQAQQAEVERSQKLQDQFVSNAQTLGVDSEVLDSAQAKVIGYGITPEIASAIVSDSDGPLIVQHLAANPMDMAALVSGDMFQAGQKWSEIKTKAAAIKPKQSAAPAPADVLSGRAAPPKDPALDGMTFE